MSSGLTLSVLLEHDLVTFARAVGVLRRRNFPVKSIAVGPSASPGLARLTIMMEVDQATGERAARQLEKIIGVREASAFPARDGVARELALVRVRAGREHHAELLDIALLYKAAILDEFADGAILEVSGSEAFVLSFLRALDGFELLEVARSGAVAVERTSGLPIPVTHTSEAVQ